MTHLSYGSDEVLRAMEPALTRALERAGIPHTLTVGEHMWHCYPALSVCPEVRVTATKWPAGWRRNLKRGNPLFVSCALGAYRCT